MSAAANPSDTSAAAPAIPHGDESFRSLIESAPQALYVVNGELRVVAFNTRAAPIFATVEPVLGTDIAELATRTWGVELASRVMERFRDTFETGESYVAPTLTEARYPVGRVESWDWQLRRVLLPDGTFGVACYFQDLTPIREAEAAVEHARARADTDLRQRSAQFEILLDKAPLGVYLVDADLRIRQVNPAALPAFRQIPELVGRSFEEVMQLLWSKSDADDIVRVFRKTLATGGSYVTSQSVERASEPGVLEYFDWRIDRIPLPDGRFGVVCYFRDVSESKRAEAALKASEDSLLENEARLELALDAANMGTFVWYPEEDRTESDARMLSLFGLLPSEKLNLAEALGKLLHVEDRKKYGAAVERAMDPRGSGTLREDIRVVHPDGSTRWVAVTAQMLFTGSPRRATRLVGTVADVDARKQIEQALRDSEERLRDTDRRKDEFLAMLAHELRNPLAPIRTGLELIRVAGNTPESIERVRTMMDRQVGHMVRLIDDLLDVSRITSGKIRLQRRPTLLTTIVNTAVEANRTALADARVDLRIELPEAPVLLDVDPTRFVQIVSNLLHNAVKFTNAAGRIEISARIDPPSEKEAGCLRLNVSDSGVGISSEMLPRVFDLFTQADAQSTQGLGIGLTLARRLVELHGGSIEASSEGRGRGAAFTIALPLPKPVSEDAPSETAAHPEEVRRRVVVIDDNVDSADMMAMFVSTLGGESRVAYSGENGLSLVANFRPDVVLLDIGMPGLDGYETCRRIRKALGESVVVVAMTGWGQERDKQQARNAGFDAHLTKPVDPTVLRKLLADVRPNG